MSMRKSSLAQCRVEVLGHLVGNLVHEINNPLSVVLGKSVLLEREAKNSDVDSATVQSVARAIFESSVRINVVLKRLTEFIRISETTDPQIIVLKNPVQKALDLLSDRISQKRIALDQFYDENLSILGCEGRIIHGVIRFFLFAFEGLDKVDSPKIHLKCFQEDEKVNLKFEFNANPAEDLHGHLGTALELFQSSGGILIGDFRSEVRTVITLSFIQVREECEKYERHASA